MVETREGFPRSMMDTGDSLLSADSRTGAIRVFVYHTGRTWDKSRKQGYDVMKLKATSTIGKSDPQKHEHPIT